MVFPRRTACSTLTSVQRRRGIISSHLTEEKESRKHCKICSISLIKLPSSTLIIPSMAVLTELEEEEEEASALYDVFLSFRGKDTRLAFTEHLYQALLNENICTFLDEEEVETGEDLKPELARAIRNSSASIIVLSENYASSTWCLDELVMILEQRRTSKHIVLPIFYHVEPTDVRKQQGSFGDALLKHKRIIEAEKDEEKKSHGARKLELWTKALTQVADLKGKDASGRKETVFIEEIVKEFSSRLDLHLRTKIPHLIGMEFSINTISSWLKDVSSKTADILTIWGMSGIGKTTLAKYIYQLHYLDFERRSFVEDIERKCAQQSSALLDLQKQLLGDIQRRRIIEVGKADVCTAKIEKSLLNKPTLLVLDGIDNFEQLDVLVGTNGFHRGSKIIITTKDGSLTEKCALFRTTFPPKHTKHPVRCLSETESLRLLCWHAFGGNDPKDGYEEDAKNVAQYCGGHPLALKVLGSSLCNEDVVVWGETFEMLKKEIYPDIQKVLHMSFNSLPSENCKELFKHIACFFVGEDRDLIETILKECGICASSGITKLIDRCLLTIVNGKRIMMHQLLQEMGRDLVRQESPKKPWKRSRSWNHEESLDLMKKQKGTDKIQGLVLDMKILAEVPLRGSSSAIEHNFQEHNFQDDLNENFRVVPSTRWVYDFFARIWWFFAWYFLMFSSSYSKKIELKTNSLAKMDNLKLLQLNYVILNGSYKNFPKGLRWLCMHGFPSKHIPSDLPMENLVALDLSNSNLKRLWKKPKFLGSLKILNVSDSKLVKAGDFFGLPALETLILNGCSNLVEVCESIGQCDRLVHLDMRYCNKLKNLPSSIRKLKNVRILLIDSCVNLREFSFDSNHANIKSQASSSTMVVVVPRSLKYLAISLPSTLVELSLGDNRLFNKSFPEDFSNLPMLERLYLNGNPIDSLPDCVRSLGRLKLLSVGECRMLKSLLCPPSTLKYLSTQNCLSLVKITFHPQMSTPPHVYYRSSRSLTEIQGIIRIQALAEIDEDILCSLGWNNLELVKNHVVQIWDSCIWDEPKKLPAQMFYEFGIFNTCFLGKEVPNWFTHTSKGSSITFTIASSPKNQRIRGLNICFVHTFSGIGKVSFARTKIRNMTKNNTWIYYAYIFALQEDDEDIIWLSHWMFGNNEIEDGDEVSVTIVEEEEDAGVVVRECGISPVYNYGDEEEDPLVYYKSWKHIIGGDLSAFQLTSGDHFLNHERFFNSADKFKELFQHKTTQNLLGYAPEYQKDEHASDYDHFRKMQVFKR